MLKFTCLVLTPDQLKSYAFSEIETVLQSHGTSLEDYKEMPKSDKSLIHDVQNRLICDELNYNTNSLVEEKCRLMSTMTVEQRKVYDRIMTRVDENKPGLFSFMFMEGHGRLIFEGQCR